MQTDDPSLLADLDLSQYSEAQQQVIAANIYAKLEARVGERVASQVNDKQFAQFETLADQADDEKLDEWLDTNLKDYDHIVGSVLQAIKQEFMADPQAFLKEENSLSAPV